MKRGLSYRKLLSALHHFLVFFLIAAFLITCTLMLFVTVMTRTLGIELTGENVEVAAKLTLLNVIALALVFTILDTLRRKMTVDRPVQRIVQAAQKMMQGDFSVRIPMSKSLDTEDKFNEIAACFNQMALALSENETLRSDFIANVSHELKTPLAVMKNYGTLLGSPHLDESDRLEYAQAITDAAGRLATLVSNILKLNKLEHQQITPTAQHFDLSAQVCECALGFEEAWEAKGLQLESEIDDGVCVRSDPELLSLVWNNLLSNAIKFTERGGTITLRVRDCGEAAEVQIADTGCGVSCEVGKHMFDKFYQGDTSHATEGNGLGLALVKRVVDMCGCDIAVESEVGVGTKFTVRLPKNG
ncbi:MAG: HAMP domain-containing histidine kinase [Clostridia bacterium]|nr:HAMP domain-containing histidine kinase [Clostridia bacterium]